MSTITRERAAQIAEGGGFNFDEIAELARIALASLEAEPVAYMYKDNLHSDARFSLHTRFGNWSQEDINEYEITEIPLYAAPPVPVADLLLSELLGIAKRAADEADECAHAEFSDDSMEYSAAIADWERRAAMLKQQSSIDVSKDAVSGADFKQPASNPTVIPDGWVMVPVEPTEDMIVNGFESEPDESFSDEKEWATYDAMSGCQQAAHRAKLCWAAMIAAAPKTEHK